MMDEVSSLGLLCRPLKDDQDACQIEPPHSPDCMLGEPCVPIPKRNEDPREKHQTNGKWRRKMLDLDTPNGEEPKFSADRQQSPKNRCI
jgi:hypothetical protein